MNEVNLQHADCLRSQSNIGETIIHNICDMSVSVVPWGTLNWFAFSIFTAIAVILASIVVASVVSIVRYEMGITK